MSEEVVYVVDPNPAIGEALSALLETYGICVSSCQDVESLETALDKHSPRSGCVLLDVSETGDNDLSQLPRILSQHANLPIIVMTRTADPGLRQRAIERGAIDVIEKPMLHQYLTHRVLQLLKKRPGGAQSPAHFTLENGIKVMIRAMRPEDADLEQAFVRHLSDRSRYLRFFSGLTELSPKMLTRLTDIDYPSRFALVATVSDHSGERQVGVARYAPAERRGVAEFAIAVADEWQGHGIASRLLRALTTAASIAGIERLEGIVQKGNDSMRELARSLNFSVEANPGDPRSIRVYRELNQA